MRKLKLLTTLILLCNLLLAQAQHPEDEDLKLDNDKSILWKDIDGVWRTQITASNNTFRITPMGQGQFLHFGDGTSGGSDTWFSSTASEVAPSTASLIIKYEGNVGVGTNSPSNKLVVKSLDNSYSTITLGLQPSANENTQGGLGVASGGIISLNGYNNLIFQTSGGNGYSEHMRIDQHGNIGIGTTSPDSELTVAGTVHSQEVKVSVDAGADFVFDKSYKSRTLEETEKYIEENKHLPEIASESEMLEKGVELGDLNIKLLQKIEELTLYLIEQNKELRLQSELYQAQQVRIEQLETKVNLLENQ